MRRAYTYESRSTTGQSTVSGATRSSFSAGVKFAQSSGAAYLNPEENEAYYIQGRNLMHPLLSTITNLNNAVSWKPREKLGEHSDLWFGRLDDSESKHKLIAKAVARVPATVDEIMFLLMCEKSIRVITSLGSVDQTLSEGQVLQTIYPCEHEYTYPNIPLCTIKRMQHKLKRKEKVKVKEFLYLDYCTIQEDEGKRMGIRAFQSIDFPQYKDADRTNGKKKIARAEFLERTGFVVKEISPGSSQLTMIARIDPALSKLEELTSKHSTHQAYTRQLVEIVDNICIHAYDCKNKFGSVSLAFGYENGIHCGINPGHIEEGSISEKANEKLGTNRTKKDPPTLNPGDIVDKSWIRELDESGTVISKEIRERDANSSFPSGTSSVSACENPNGGRHTSVPSPPSIGNMSIPKHVNSIGDSDQTDNFSVYDSRSSFTEASTSTIQAAGHTPNEEKVELIEKELEITKKKYQEEAERARQRELELQALAERIKKLEGGGTVQPEIKQIPQSIPEHSDTHFAPPTDQQRPQSQPYLPHPHPNQYQQRPQSQQYYSPINPDQYPQRPQSQQYYSPINPDQYPQQAPPNHYQPQLHPGQYHPQSQPYQHQPDQYPPPPQPHHEQQHNGFQQVNHTANTGQSNPMESFNVEAFLQQQFEKAGEPTQYVNDATVSNNQHVISSAVPEETPTESIPVKRNFVLPKKPEPTTEMSEVEAILMKTFMEAEASKNEKTSFSPVMEAQF